VPAASQAPLEFSSECEHDIVQKTETGTQTHPLIPITTDQVTPMEQADQHLNIKYSEILHMNITIT